MFVLLLNDMRSPNVENVQPVVWADTEAELRDFLKQETVPSYEDRLNGLSWGKSFRKGGPLEWYNPPYTNESIAFRKLFSPEEAAELTREFLDDLKRRVPRAPFMTPRVGANE